MAELVDARDSKSRSRKRVRVRFSPSAHRHNYCDNTQSTHYSGVEQLAAREAHNLQVVGSSPTPAMFLFMLASTFFDILIFIGIVSSGFYCFHTLHHFSTLAKIPRNNRIPFIFATVVFIILIYGSFIEPQLISVNNVSYSFPPHKSLASTKRIVLISDIHVGPYKHTAYSKRTVDRIKNIKPDAVLIAGDFFLEYSALDAAYMLEPYRELATLFPTIAVMGNHEFNVGNPDLDPSDFEEADSARNIIKNLGMLELEDAQTILFPDDPIHLIGAQDLWSHVDNFDGIKLPDDTERSIVLVHNPDLIFKVKNKVDLVLAGHTHGGQIRLPLIGAIGQPGNTPLPRSKFEGWSAWEHTKLFITSGLGESGPRARLFNPPEIVVMELR